MTGPEQRARTRSAELQQLLDESPADQAVVGSTAAEPSASGPAVAEPTVAEPERDDPAVMGAHPELEDSAEPAGSYLRPAQPEDVARLAFERQVAAGPMVAPTPPRSPATRLVLAGAVAAAVVAAVVLTAIRFSGRTPEQPGPAVVVSVLDTGRTATASEGAGPAATTLGPTAPPIPATAAAPAAPADPGSVAPPPAPPPVPPSRTTAPGPTLAPAPPAVTAPPAPPAATALPTISSRTVDPSLQPNGPSVVRPGDANPGTVITGTSELSGWVPIPPPSGSGDPGR